MTEQKPAGDDAPQQVFVPVSAHQAEPEKEPEKETKEGGKKKEGEGAPVGQIAAGGVGATVLGSYALASVVGPWGWVAAPAAATAAGAGYVAYRRRKKKGARSERRTEKTTTSKGSTSLGRLGSLGGGLGGSRAGSPASGGRSGRPSGAKGSSSRTASGGTSGGGGSKGGGSARPGGGSRPGSASPRGGSVPRGSSPRGGAAPRGGGGGTAPRPGSSGGRTGGGGTTNPGSGRNGSTGGSDGVPNSKKKPGTPTSPNTGKPGAGRGGTGGGSMPDKKPGPFRRARDWADDKTGGAVSSGWRAARGQRGFNNRRKAARDAGGGGFLAGLIGIFAALFAGIAALAGGAKPWAERQLDNVDPDAKQPDGAPDEQPAATGSGGGSGPKPNRETPPKPQPQGGPKAEDQQPDQNKTDPEPNTGPETEGDPMQNRRNLPHATAAAELQAAAARQAPQDLFEVIDQAAEWEDYVRDSTMSIKRYVQQIQGANIPLGAKSIEALQTLYNAQSQLMAAAQEIPNTMRSEHAVDLDRRNHSRGDERKSNV